MTALVCLAGALEAQEHSAEAEIGFQQYYLAMNSQRISNVSGVLLGYRQLIPGLGLLSVNLAPASADGRFRAGDTFLQLKGLPWKGQYWTLHGGDFRLPGRFMEVPFPNLYYAEIAGRGGWVEVSHGNRTVGFFGGAATLQSGARVSIRVQVPQTMAGAYVKQKIGSRLEVGARFIHFSNDLAALHKPGLSLATANPLERADTATLHALYTLAGPLKWYGEAGWSASTVGGASGALRRVPMSAMAGPLLESKRFTFKGNYVYQNRSYLPLLGYALGDRKGSYGEVRVRPLERFELYGSASEYRNNLERDPALPTFRSSGQSAGASIALPLRFQLGGQLSTLRLNTRRTEAEAGESSNNQQLQVDLSRPIRRHNLRVTAREFRQISRIGPQRQRTGELEDVFVFKRFVLGAAVRTQRLIAAQSKTSIFYRGMGQARLGPLSVYANIETGNDLVNRTVFATNTISSTVIGGNLSLRKSWDIQVEAFRNNLVTELNPQNIFVLQGQGVYIPGILSTLNQWSIYFRLTRRFQWGRPLPAAVNDVAAYVSQQAPLKGTVEGFVFEGSEGGRIPVEGIPVALDQGRVEQTNAEGRFRFDDVAEGAHKVALAFDQLPADYNPGDVAEARAVVRSGRVERADFEVVRLYALKGRVSGPEAAPLDGILIRLLPTTRYTTPDSKGSFFFYNVAAGNYEVALDERMLPGHSVMLTPARVPVSVVKGKEPEPVVFRFEIQTPSKAIRTIILNP